MQGPANPSDAGLQHFELRSYTQDKHAPIIYWENDNANDAPIILYFHGNGGGLFAHAPAINYLAKQQFHIVAMEYPGYPGNEGIPSESLIVAQANSLFEHIAKQYPKQKFIIWGYSLGSGIATQLAAHHPPAALVLQSPFTAIADRASELFPFFPVQWMMRNSYRSHIFIGKVHTPLLILHGTTDAVIPVHHARALFALANEPKTLKEYEGYGHNDMLQSKAYDDAIAFIRQTLAANHN